MGENAQAPPKAVRSRESALTAKKAALFLAVWEAVMFMTACEIREHVEATLREIQSDEP